MKKVYDLHHMDREFAIGNWVYSRLQPYRQTSLYEKKYKTFTLILWPIQGDLKDCASCLQIGLPVGSGIQSSMFQLSKPILVQESQLNHNFQMYVRTMPRFFQPLRQS